MFWASMGPRPADRGNESASAAESAFAVLQWGRDQLIAEMTRKHLDNWDVLCFNGAATS